jgi:DNA-binding response OmpR family regulator
VTDLKDKTVLVVEDDYFIAMELCRNLETAGAEVIGPVGRVGDALAKIARSDRIDGALLDLNLHGAMAFPVADKLCERGVPFMFTTGYDASVIPEKYRDIARSSKPVTLQRISTELFD